MPAVNDIASADQSVWLDGVSPTQLRSGVIEQWRQTCPVGGLATAPTQYTRALVDDSAVRAAVTDRADEAEIDPERVFWDLAVEDLQAAADLLTDRHRETDGADGFVALELPAQPADDSSTLVARAAELVERVGRPNLMVSVAGTREGIRAVEELTARGVSTNVCQLFGVSQTEAAREAYLDGLERRHQAEQPLGGVASVATVSITSLDAIGNDMLPDANRNELSLAVARLAYERWQMAHTVNRRWAKLRRAGARPQRLAWAASQPHDPALGTTFYPERLIAPETVLAVPAETLDAVSQLDKILQPRLDRRDVGKAVHVSSVAAEHAAEPDSLAGDLQSEQVARSAHSFDELLSTIQKVARSKR
jgi:transaldolase